MGTALAKLAPARSANDLSQLIQTRAEMTDGQDFDLLVGEWRVRHRRMKPDTNEWVEFDGISSNRKVIILFSD
jgi:hypothetical protein